MGNFKENDVVLENYRIEKSIGRGAFGEVYLATDTGLNGKRAIKVLLRDDIGVGSSSFNNYRDRFRQEAQLMEWFNNPHIVRIYNFQEVDNTLFLVMEYAPGGSLQQKMDQARENGRKFTPEDVARIGIDIADGLAALHSRDVVHRDLKPSNILFNAEGNAKVADLGLAQVPGAQSTRTELSNPLPHPGTQAYMSPEHANANIYLTPPSDIYALGLILFEMMTGRNHKILEPGKRLRDIRPDAPEWLDDLLARMLNKDPEKRPWNGVKAAEELRKGLSEELAKKKDEKISDGPPSDEKSLDKQILLLFEQGMAAIREKDWQAAQRATGALKTLGEKGKEAAARIEALIPTQFTPVINPWKKYQWIAPFGLIVVTGLVFLLSYFFFNPSQKNNSPDNPTPIDQSVPPKPVENAPANNEPVADGKSSIFADNFSTDEGWTDQSEGRVFRDKHWEALTWKTSRDTTTRYYIPLNMGTTNLTLSFRFNVFEFSGNGSLAFGLAEELQAPKQISEVNATGFFTRIARFDNSNWIYPLAIFNDGTHFESSRENWLNFPQDNTWYRVNIDINQTNWSVTLMDESDNSLGKLSGSLDEKHTEYRYLILVFDKVGGWESANGMLDDILIINRDNLIQNTGISPKKGIGTTRTRNKDGMVMAYVPQGPFVMGSFEGNDDNKPAHIETLNAFWMDTTEVTNGEYEKCVSEQACSIPSDLSSATRQNYYTDSEYQNYPVIHVDWFQAQKYCEWAGSRLPTEAEWEKAARGTDARIYPWGWEFNPNFLNNDSSDTREVGLYAKGKSPYGIFDMAGNVFEWIESWYDVYPEGDTSSSKYFGEKLHILRGGSWGSKREFVQTYLRSSGSPMHSEITIGFRCALSE